MKKVLFTLAALCCTMALSATTYTSHLKVTINGTSTEQDQVSVQVVEDDNTYTLTLKNFVLVAEGIPMPVGNIEVAGVKGIDEYGYTTITFNSPVAITAGDDPQYDFWMGPELGEVPLDLVARFTDTALSANIDINLEFMGQIIGVQLFGVAPAPKTGDVNKDGEVNIADVNNVIDIILND
jgi:hypothetical protein